MYPHGRSLVERMAGKPFVLLGINSDPDREVARKAVEENQLSWRSWWDGTPPGPIATQWNVRGWPSYVVVDHQGVIRFKDIRTPWELDHAVDALVKRVEGDAGSNLQDPAKNLE